MAKAWSKGLIGERSGSESESESEKDMESSGDETGKTETVSVVPRKGVPLVEAVTLGMYDPKTKLVTEPQTGRKMNLRQALDSGTVLPDGVMVKDKNTGHVVPLDILQKMGLIDLDKGTIIDSTGSYIPIEKAVQDGIMFEGEILVEPNHLYLSSTTVVTTHQRGNS